MNSKFQDMYESWWLNKKCRVTSGSGGAGGPFKLVTQVELVGNPSFVYGTVVLHFSDGTNRNVSPGKAFRPRKTDVEVLDNDDLLILDYALRTFRAAGLEAKRQGKYILVRNPSAKLEHQRTRWWKVDKGMFSLMRQVGILEGFESATLVGDILSVPA